MIIVAHDDHIPLVEEDLAGAVFQKHWRHIFGSTGAAFEVDVVCTIGYGAEAVNPIAITMVVAPICMAVASAVSQQGVHALFGDFPKSKLGDFPKRVSPAPVRYVMPNADGAGCHSNLTYIWRTCLSRRHDHKLQGQAAYQAFQGRRGGKRRPL